MNTRWDVGKSVLDFFYSLTHSNLEHVLWQAIFAGHTTLKYNRGDQKCGRRSEPSERATQSVAETLPQPGNKPRRHLTPRRQVANRTRTQGRQHTTSGASNESTHLPSTYTGGRVPESETHCQNSSSQEISQHSSSTVESDQRSVANQPDKLHRKRK